MGISRLLMSLIAILAFLTPIPAQFLSSDVSDVLTGLSSRLGSSSSCKAGLGKCSGEIDDEFQLSSQFLRRLLQQQQQQYISYGSLSRDKTPCPAGSGRSYYTNNCNKASGPANPTQRGCSTISRCARDSS